MVYAIDHRMHWFLYILLALPVAALGLLCGGYLGEQCVRWYRISGFEGAALENADFYAGLTQALMEVRAFHPPPVVEALWRGLETRGPGVAVHFAAMLCYLHGQASSPFDMSQRPYFLRFRTDTPEERLPLIRELRDRLASFPVRPADVLGSETRNDFELQRGAT